MAKKARKRTTKKARCPHCRKVIYIGGVERIKSTTIGMGPLN